MGNPIMKKINRINPIAKQLPNKRKTLQNKQAKKEIYNAKTDKDT